MLPNQRPLKPIFKLRRYPQGIGVQSDKNAASACFWAGIIVQSKNEIAKGHSWCQCSAADRGVH
jgi:hypothetical protein